MGEKNELQLSRDLNVITAEINSYKQVAGQAIFEIGRRLKHVKEHDLVHGEWDKWCNEELGFSRRYANQYIKVAEEFGENGKTYSQLGVNALYHIATLPQEEREKEHVTSKGETKTVDEMTVRELQEVKRKNRDLEQAKQQAESQAEQYKKSEKIARELLEKEQNKKPEVVEKEVYKEIDNTDYAQINSLQEQLLKKGKEINYIKNQFNELKNSTQEYEKLKESLNQLYRDKEEVEEQIEAAVSISGLQVNVEEFIRENIAGIKFSPAVRERLDSYTVQENLNDIGNMLIEAGEDVKNLIPKHGQKDDSNIIDAEIIN